MKQLTTPILIICTLLLNLLIGCDGLDENYSTNPNHRLSFSTDTLSFDTVFTTIGSATKQFMVYNHNDEPLNIERIIQYSPATSGFRINVDGRKGDSFDNVRIAANDSMYIFVEVTINPNEQDQPLLVQDSILFNYNSITQVVLLEACGQDVKLIKGGEVIASDTKLTAERPYLIYDSLVINQGATVEIEAGTTFYLHNNARILVDGTIKANGTQERPITFRGDRLDFILEDQLPYDRTPGQWEGITFRSSSYDNLFNYVIVRNGNNGVVCEASTPDKPKLTISNSQLTNMDGNVLTATNSLIEASNSEFSNATATVAYLNGGSYHFTHCTFANYISAKSRRSFAQDGESSFTLQMAGNNGLQAQFDNTIIDGSFGAGKEITISGDNLEYQFNHCVLMMQPMENESFTDVQFIDGKEGSKMTYHMTGGQANKYMYDFRPDTTIAPGVGKADIEIAKLFPIDRTGVDRLTNDGPDIGAYEYIPYNNETTE